MSNLSKGDNTCIVLSALSILFCTQLHAADSGRLKILIPRERLVTKDLREQGAFADIYEGVYGGNQKVAIKAFHIRHLPPHLEYEFQGYNNLATEGSPLVHFYGVCNERNSFLMVMELTPFSLAKFYQLYFLSFANIYNFGDQIAQGLQYLHNNSVAHGNLKSSNVFLTSDLVVKISDFGLSRIKLESSSSGAVRGNTTVRWRAPETFTRDYIKTRESIEVQKPVDMYAFGILLWEMATRSKPFSAYSETQTVELLIKATKEKINPTWPIPFKDLLDALWARSPSSRPTTDNVIQKFQDPTFATRTALVLGYNNLSNDSTLVIVEGQGHLMLNEVAKKCTLLAKSNKGNSEGIALPQEITLKAFGEFYNMARVDPTQWETEFTRRYEDGTLPDVLNTAGPLGFTLLFEEGSKFVADQLKIYLMVNPIEVRTSLVLPREIEMQEDEFEQVLLGVLRQKNEIERAKFEALHSKK